LSDLAAEDRRVQRTKAALVGAFLHLVLDRRYDQITVADIVGRAGVGRSTFYEHYDNKDELLTEGLMGPFSVLADMVVGAADQGQVLETIEHFWENRRVGNVLFAGPTRQLVMRTLASAIEQRLQARLRTANPSELPAPLASAYLASAQVGLLSEWLSGHTSCPPGVVADALRRMSASALARDIAT
jgi:AcrR family transcriptional regulator